MPDELKQKISEAAEANSRSVHAELLARLQESFSPREEAVTKAQMDEVLEEIRHVNHQNARSLGLVRHWLAEHVLELYAEVPAERRFKRFSLYRDIARSIRTDGCPGLEDLLWQLAGGNPEQKHVAEGMAHLVRRSQGPWIGMLAAPEPTAPAKRARKPRA